MEPPCRTSLSVNVNTRDCAPVPWRWTGFVATQRTSWPLLAALRGMSAICVAIDGGVGVEKPLAARTNPAADRQLRRRDRQRPRRPDRRRRPRLHVRPPSSKPSSRQTTATTGPTTTRTACGTTMTPAAPQAAPKRRDERAASAPADAGPGRVPFGCSAAPRRPRSAAPADRASRAGFGRVDSSGYRRRLGCDVRCQPPQCGHAYARRSRRRRRPRT